MAQLRPVDGATSGPANLCRPLVAGLGLLLGLLQATLALASPRYQYTPDFVIRSWHTSEGMPEGSAPAIAQSADGYLWVGTFGGLTRFDGVEFERVTAPEAGLTPTVMVTALLATTDGRLWASTDHGVFVFEGRRLLRGHGQAGWPAGEYVRSWTETPAGIVAATFNGHCVRFEAGAWRELPEPDARRGGFTVKADTAGQLWAMKDSYGYRWRQDRWERLVTPEPRPVFRSLCRSHAGGVWFLSNSGLWRAEGERVWLERPGQSVTIDPWSAYEDSRGRLWLSSILHGLDLFRPDGTTLRLNQTNGLTADSLRVAFEDRDGDVWLGSSGGGLMCFRERRFTILGRSSGLTSLAVNQLRLDRSGAVVAATQGGGVHVLRDGLFRELDPPRETNNFVFAHATAEQPDGTVWGAFDYGLCRRRGDAWERIEHPELRERKVRGVFVDRRGTLWAACEQGIAKWLGDRIEFIQPSKLKATFIQLVDQPGGGLLAASSGHGLWQLAPDGNLRQVAPEKLGELGIFALLPLGDAVWFATSDGRLGRVRTDGVTIVAVPGVDANAPVLSLVDDAAGNLWLGTARGLLRLPATAAATAADGRPLALSARAFGAAEGVANLEFRRNHQPSAIRDGNGHLWFATGVGLLRFDPTATGPDLPPLMTAIRSMHFFEPTAGRLPATPRRLDDPPPSLTVAPGGSLFTFRLVGLEFAAPEFLRFRARLVTELGPEAPWQDLSEPRVSFPLLPAGRYRFEATAARLGQPWNPQPAQVDFEILAPWWQRPVFRASALTVLAVVLLAGGGLLYGLRTRRFRERLADEARRLDERRESERQNRLLRELLDQSADSIFVVTVPDGRLADASASVERHLGHPPGDRPSLDLSALGLLPPGKGWPAFLASLRPGMAVRFETELRHRDGHPVPVEVEARLSTRGGEEFVLAIARDISERQAAAQRERLLETQLRDAQKLEAVGRLAGGIAHDFNNLLQIIRGFTDILRQDPAMSAAAREESLAEVSRAAARASDLTRQLLAFSRREAVEMRRCQLGQCVEESLRLLRPLVGTHIRIEAEIPGNLPWVLADGGQLGQVLLNLAANARDAMPHGGTIRLGLRETEFSFEGADVPAWALPGRGVELSFADSGEGIGPDRLSRIFEPFYTTKERGKGTGLGLAVVYGIVQQHRGRIAVESTVGQGTTFRIVLPACVPGELPPTGAAPMSAPAPTEPRRILVVDDETTILQLAERVLSGAGHLVFPVADGAAAIRTFAANVRGIDLVLLDVLMPGLTGWAVAHELRRLRPDLPILFCSGYATEEGEREIAALPGARLLLKPFTPTELLVEVELLASQHPTKPD